MACVLYKDGEKILVEPMALDGMLSQGWTTKPEYPEIPPTAAEFAEFLKMHEELKRTSDSHIERLVIENGKLTEDIEVLEGEIITVRHELAFATEKLIEQAKKEQGEKTVSDIPETQEPQASKELSAESQVSQIDFAKLNIGQLRAHAKRAEIPNYELMRKPQLIKALKNGSKTEN